MAFANTNKQSWPTHYLSDGPRLKKGPSTIQLFCHSFGVLFQKRLIFKSSGGIFLKFLFQCFLMGLFSLTRAFSGGFWQIYNGPTTLKIEENEIQKVLFDSNWLGTLPKKKKTGKCGNFSQVGDSPPSPLFGNDTFVKKKYGLFCISGPQRGETHEPK